MQATLSCILARHETQQVSDLKDDSSVRQKCRFWQMESKKFGLFIEMLRIRKRASKRQFIPRHYFGIMRHICVLITVQGLSFPWCVTGARLPYHFGLCVKSDLIHKIVVIRKSTLPRYFLGFYKCHVQAFISRMAWVGYVHTAIVTPPSWAIMGGFPCFKRDF